MNVLRANFLMLCLAAVAATDGLVSPAAARAADQSSTVGLNDVPADFKSALPERDFTRREVMIPDARWREAAHADLRAEGAKDAPVLLNRTPYDAQLALAARQAVRRCWARCRWPTSTT